MGPRATHTTPIRIKYGNGPDNVKGVPLLGSFAGRLSIDTF